MPIKTPGGGGLPPYASGSEEEGYSINNQLSLNQETIWASQYATGGSGTFASPYTGNAINSALDATNPDLFSRVFLDGWFEEYDITPSNQWKYIDISGGGIFKPANSNGSILNFYGPNLASPKYLWIHGVEIHGNQSNNGGFQASSSYNGHGIRLQRNGDSVRWVWIYNNYIHDIGGDYSSGGDGIYMRLNPVGGSTENHIFVHDNILENFARDGISITEGGDIKIHNNKIRGQSHWGINLEGSGTNPTLHDVSVENNDIIGESGEGVSDGDYAVGDAPGAKAGIACLSWDSVSDIAIKENFIKDHGKTNNKDDAQGYGICTTLSNVTIKNNHIENCLGGIYQKGSPLSNTFESVTTYPEYYLEKSSFQKSKYEINRGATSPGWTTIVTLAHNGGVNNSFYLFANLVMESEPGGTTISEIGETSLLTNKDTNWGSTGTTLWQSGGGSGAMRLQVDASDATLLYFQLNYSETYQRGVFDYEWRLNPGATGKAYIWEPNSV